MKDPVENALESLRPAELPSDLMARLAAARSQCVEAPVRRIWRRWLVPLTAGACAAVIALAFLRREPADAPRPSLAGAPIPFEREDYLIGARDVGIVVAPDQRPYRFVELEWLEQETVRAREQGPALRIETKRREIVPVALEIF